MRLTRLTVLLMGTIEIAAWAVVLLYLLASWYPGEYSELFGIGLRCAGLLGAMLVLGPVLGLLFYKPDKRVYANDLSVMFVVRLVVLAFGLHLSYSQRPLLVVFSVDRFVVVQAHQISLDQAPPVIVKMILSGSEPPVIAARRLPPGDLGAMLDLLGGAPDIEYQPGQYEKLEYQKEAFYERMCGTESHAGSEEPRGNVTCEKLTVPLVYKVDSYATAIFDSKESRISQFELTDPW